MKTTLTFALAGLLLVAAVPAQARIKLTTLPERDSVRIDIQNGRYTLVEEERTVNLQAGRNQVDFSWANIGIDKDSIVFRVIRSDGVMRCWLSLDIIDPSRESAWNHSNRPSSEDTLSRCRQRQPYLARGLRLRQS